MMELLVEGKDEVFRPVGSSEVDEYLAELLKKYPHVAIVNQVFFEFTKPTSWKRADYSVDDFIGTNYALHHPTLFRPRPERLVSFVGEARNDGVLGFMGILNGFGIVADQRSSYNHEGFSAHAELEVKTANLPTVKNGFLGLSMVDGRKQLLVDGYDSLAYGGDNKIGHIHSFFGDAQGINFVGPWLGNSPEQLVALSNQEWLFGILGYIANRSRALVSGQQY